MKIVLLLFLAVLVITFQAQLPDGSNDNNPYIEQPTREAYSHFTPPRLYPEVVTINDYDNFDVNIDFYEQQVSSHPNNPSWIFFGVNATSSPQNARGTTDGGLTWYLNNPMYPSGTCCDPWSAYTGSGVLVYGSGVNGQYVYRSTNNGLTWATPVLSVSGNDRNNLAAEVTGTGPYANYVYAAMTPGNFGRSTDEGATWTTTFTTNNSLPGCYITVGPNGATNGGCVIYCAVNGTPTVWNYNFWRSTNGGANFTLMSTQQFAGYVGFWTGARHTINNVRTNPHPKMAMDNSNGPYRGRLYLVYASNDPPGNGNKPDVWLRYSADQGATWSGAARINDNPNPELSDQWFPEIWCERTTGILYIHWYDDRNGPATFQMDMYATYTADGGASFAPNQRITNMTWTFPNPACSPNCYRGDYTGITANAQTSFSVWSDHRNGTALNMGAYFPDFAMRTKPDSSTLNNMSDSSFHFVSIPGVKLWNRVTKFSTTVTPAPLAGTITLSLLNRTTNLPLDSLTAYPDSLKLRIRTSGGVTPGVYSVAIKANGTNGTPVHRRTVTLTVLDLTGIAYHNRVPEVFHLYQNYPNPFNPATRIKFDIPAVETRLIASLRIFDLLGREVASLINENLKPGSYEVDWNASDYPSGVYFYELVSGEYSAIKKMILIK
jgi:type IX secretion system substrate protein